MIFDSHAHYDDEAFDEDRDSLLAGMRENNVGYIVNVGASMKGVLDTAKLMEKWPFVYGAIGIHPDDAGCLDDDKMEILKELCLREKAVAVGEIGLDYYWDKENHACQKKWFARQLELAKELKMPVVVHSRDAARDTFDLLKSEHRGETGGVIHCFSNSREMAREYLKMGYYIGIGGVVTFKNAKTMKEVVEYVPLDRILVETDCPYLAPVPFRGKRNSSLNLPYVIEEIARIKQVSPQEVEDITCRNAKEMYRIEG